MSAVIIKTGDTIAIPIVLKKNGETFAITPTAIVQGLLRTAQQPVGPTVTLNDNHPDSDWSNSRLVFQMTSAQSEDLPLVPVTLEIQVNEAGNKTTWLQSNIQVQKGLIP